MYCAAKQSLMFYLHQGMVERRVRVKSQVCEPQKWPAFQKYQLEKITYLKIIWQRGSCDVGFLKAQRAHAKMYFCSNWLKRKGLGSTHPLTENFLKKVKCYLYLLSQ